MRISGIELVSESLIPDIIDSLEHHCTVEEYYKLNHASQDSQRKLRRGLTALLESWLNEEGIASE